MKTAILTADPLATLSSARFRLFLTLFVEPEHRTTLRSGKRKR